MGKEGQVAQFGRCISKSQILARGKIAIHSVTLIATSGGTGDVTIYDGDNTSAEKKIKVMAPASGTQQVIFPRGYPFNQAMYVAVGSNVDCVYITWSFREG